MKKSLLSLFVLSAVTLSGCGYELRKVEAVNYVPVRVESPHISLSDVREVYKDSHVEIYDINKYPSEYGSQQAQAKTKQQYPLDKSIRVQDRSVEIYDIGFAPSIASQSSSPSLNREPVAIAPLSPPSQARDDYSSPFFVVEEDGMLTDPANDDTNTQTSVIVPPSEAVETEDDFELMTGF